MAPEPDQTGDIDDQRRGVMACRSFLERASNSDLLAKELSIPFDFLRLESELQPG